MQLSVFLGLLMAVLAIAQLPVSLAGLKAAPALRSQSLSLPGLAASAPTAVADEIIAAPVPLTLFAPEVTEEAIVAAADATDEAVAALEQAQSEGADDLGLALDETNAPRTTLFVEHTVAPGDTLSSIAQRHDVGVDYVRWNNADVTADPTSLRIGEVLAIPSIEGILYDVRIGDTLHDVVSRYNADLDDVLQFAPNGLADPDDLREGAQLLVVGGTPPASLTIRPAGDEGAPTGWRWPTVGVITSEFGPGHTLGIDIGVPMRTPIYAARAGQVAFAGGNRQFSYGVNVVLDHGGGYDTRYAHLESLAVAPGTTVEAGAVIGYSGSTGRSTGPHLHFEINRDGQTQNPMMFLP